MSDERTTGSTGGDEAAGETASREPAAFDSDEESTGLSIQVGDQVPSIGLRASDGFLLNLRSYVGRSPAALCFFAAPTAEGAQGRRGTRLAEALVAARERFTEAGVAVAGITCDNERQQAEWIAAHDFPYLLFSDERRSAVSVLGIPLSHAGENHNVERPWILVVHRDGRLAAVLRDPDPEYAPDVILAAARRGDLPVPAGPAAPAPART